MSDNEKIQGINLDTKFVEQSSTEELSSETRINSYWSFRENESLENTNVCDFEVNSSLFSCMIFFFLSPNKVIVYNRHLFGTHMNLTLITLGVIKQFIFDIVILQKCTINTSFCTFLHKSSNQVH
jgi:hypothetical protein